QFCGAATGAFGQVALRLSLQAPGNAFDQPDLVVRRRRLTANFGKLDAEFGDAQPRQRNYLGSKIRKHGRFSVGCNSAVSATAHPTEPRISADRKAISERFPQISSSPKRRENLGLFVGIALRCRAGLGSLAQHSGTADGAGPELVHRTETLP